MVVKEIDQKCIICKTYSLEEFQIHAIFKEYLHPNLSMIDESDCIKYVQGWQTVSISGGAQHNCASKK